MTKNPELEITWPVSYINVDNFYGSTKKEAICWDCFHYDAQHSDDLEYNSSGRNSYDDKTSTFTSPVVCNTCAKTLVTLKPNPYTIPELPNLGDVKFSWVMTKALDNVFTDAYVFHNTQVWKTANPGKEPTFEDRGVMYTYPDFYSAHKCWLENVTFQKLGEIKKVLAEYLNGLTTKVTTGISTNAGSAKMNLKKLGVELDKQMARAFEEAVNTREEAITRARKSTLQFGERDVYEIRLVEDSNCGMVKVGAFNMTPQGSSKWVNTHSEFSREITVYITVNADREAEMAFQQDIISKEDGAWVRNGHVSSSLDEAIAKAKEMLQVQIDACETSVDQNAIYAMEALRTAGLSLTA